MGCQQSLPEEPLTTVGKSFRADTPQVRKQQYHKKESSSLKGGQARGSSKSWSEKEESLKSAPLLNDLGQLMQEEIAKRTTSSVTVKKVTVGTEGRGNVMQIRYAYWSQRGYYPDDPHKENQDRFSVTTQFGGEENDLLLGIYDGHGADGHDCAQYTKKHLPKIMAKNLRQKRVKNYQAMLTMEGKSLKGSFKPELWPGLPTSQYKEACKRSFVECNKKMHADDDIRDKFSGTTAVTVGFHFGRMTVCNVGDSRAILGHRIGGGDNQSILSEETKREIGSDVHSIESKHDAKLIAVPLTNDQTPYRKDERERVKKAGAVIMSVDQMEGRSEHHDDWDMVLGRDIDIEGDLPRIWCKDKDYPGCAFTRSIGDEIAGNIGVIAEPETLTVELTARDEILVIATDGVFEFLTSDTIIDICSECLNPLEACEKVAKASYAEWLKYENRTDDMTMIICFLGCLRDPGANTDGTTIELVRNTRDSLNRGNEQSSQLDHFLSKSRSSNSSS